MVKKCFSGGGAGHTIKNDSGTALTQKDNLKFVGTYSTNSGDDSVINITRSMTSEQYALLSSDEKKGLINVTDESGYAFDADDIAYDSNNSVKDMLDKMCYRLIASSPSGKTYVQQLTEIATTFNALSKTQKATAVLCLSDEIFKCVDSRGRFVKMDVSGSSVIFSGFDVTNKTYHYAIASFTITDGSSLVASSDMELYILGK